MKKFAMLTATTALVAAFTAVALAAPAIPQGATPPHGPRGTCTNCHTYATPTPAPTPKPVATAFVRVWGSTRAVSVFTKRASGYLFVAFAGHSTRRAVFAVKAVDARRFLAAAKARFGGNADSFPRTKTRGLMTTLGYALPVK